MWLVLWIQFVVGIDPVFRGIGRSGATEKVTGCISARTVADEGPETSYGHGK